MKILFKKYRDYFRRDNSQLLHKTTNRIFSAILALISGYYFNWLLVVYAYIAASIALDILFYKVLKRQESYYKTPEYFAQHRINGEEYDRFKKSLLNARILVFVGAHALILLDVSFPFVLYCPFISIIFVFAMFFATIYVGHRYGYHAPAGDGKYPEFYSPERRTGYGLPGYVCGVYTGDPHDVGT